MHRHTPVVINMGLQISIVFFPYISSLSWIVDYQREVTLGDTQIVWIMSPYFSPES